MVVRVKKEAQLFIQFNKIIMPDASFESPSSACVLAAVTAFFQEHAPDQLHKVPAMCKRYDGIEHALHRRLTKELGEAPAVLLQTGAAVAAKAREAEKVKARQERERHEQDQKEMRVREIANAGGSGTRAVADGCGAAAGAVARSTCAFADAADALEELAIAIGREKKSSRKMKKNLAVGEWKEKRKHLSGKSCASSKMGKVKSKKALRKMEQQAAAAAANGGRARAGAGAGGGAGEGWEEKVKSLQAVPVARFIEDGEQNPIRDCQLSYTKRKKKSRKKNAKLRT